MRATALLADLCRQGASLVVAGDRIRVEAPSGVLTPTVREALALQKPDIVRLLPFAEEYRTLLRSFRDAEARLIDELGPPLAAAIRDVAERQ